ncbi:methyltransferase domain-containing protein [Candidatus Woesearchaeota archaeon]|nr:methyltransferase domain-containing protein [Candidatus Woesearchaeota archaeon]
MKIALAEDNHAFLIKDETQDYHCQFGTIKKEDLEDHGKTITTNKGKELSILNPTFSDLFCKIKRSAQIIPLKDMGSIISRTFINKQSKVVDAGVGSAALCCFLAYYAKKVISCDIREDHISIGKKNKELLGLKNLEFKLHDIYEGIPSKEIDLLTLDVPEPWKVIPHAETTLKTGSMIVAYCPTVPQVMDYVNALEHSGRMIHTETIEIIERAWEVKGRKVRPFSRIIAHSGFLTFARKVN